MPEEYLPALDGGRTGGTHVDLTFEGPDGDRVRIQTVTPLSTGEMDKRECGNFNLIFEKTGETVIAIPKPR